MINIYVVILLETRKRNW